jgi:hypothetical protein
MQRDVGRPVAALELLAGAAWTWIVAARIRRLVELPESFPRGAAGKPVGMDVASGRGNPINKSLMACNAILVRLDQFLQPLPAALGAIKLDHLKPVRPRVNQRLPARSVKCDALDIANAPFVNDWHAVSGDLVRIEARLIVLRAMDQRECQHIGVSDQQAQNALRLLLAPKPRRLLALSWSQTQRSHSEGMMVLGPDSTAQMKPSKV